MSLYDAKNMKDVIRYNKMVGQYFFERDTMEFFGSKVECELLENNCFITSEDDFRREKRLYTIRRYDPNTAHIDTVGGFQKFKTFNAAMNAAKSYATCEC